MHVVVDQVYSEKGGQALRFDFFRPDVSEPLPLVICLHGGGWISGSKEDYRDVGEQFCHHGLAAAIPNYRLAPLHPFPAAVEDIAEFVKFCRGACDEMGILPDKIGSIGNSAGGHLAAMSGLCQDHASRVNAVVDICGITDLRDSRETHLPIAWAFLDQFMPFDPIENPEVYVQASPICIIDATAPPFLVIHGEEDDVVPVSQSDRFVGALKEAGVPVEYHRYPHEAHSFTLQAWNSIEAAAMRFFRDRLIGIDDADVVAVSEDGLRG